MILHESLTNRYLLLILHFAEFYVTRETRSIKIRCNQEKESLKVVSLWCNWERLYYKLFSGVDLFLNLLLLVKTKKEK